MRAAVEDEVRAEALAVERVRAAQRDALLGGHGLEADGALLGGGGNV